MSRILSRLGLLVASLALVLSFAPQASAQQPGVDANGDGAADVSVDRDTIGDGIHFAGVEAQPNPNGDTGNVGGTGGGDAGLAYTGAETEAIMAVSIGLLALGGSVLVTSRRRLNALD